VSDCSRTSGRIKKVVAELLAARLSVDLSSFLFVEVGRRMKKYFGPTTAGCGADRFCPQAEAAVRPVLDATAFS